MNDEYIDRAAIKVGADIYTGRRHPEIAYDIYLSTGNRPEGMVRGFVTDTGRFVSRKAAARIAYEAGQTYGILYDFLYSEDVW